MQQPDSCPLCQCSETNLLFYQKKFKRNFYECSLCSLIFIARSDLISHHEERKRYELHENSFISQGYRTFLERLVLPIKKRISQQSIGLDFGEGPYPMLRQIFSEHGFDSVKGYDPFFNSDHNIFLKKYDFITMCEVIEHMNDPLKDLETTIGLLKPGGMFVVSTGLVTTLKDLESWYYINDITHINFFSEKTFKWLGERFSLELLDTEKDLVIFLKK